ncbi:SHOCT domain-containing protein [Nitriliruptoria bacterium AS10]|nr:PH domain-containing protein [Salsipaludibacter albus]MBY5163145.1 SHOCT domain-containing protein [Salsipaludibacter albus]
MAPAGWYPQDDGRQRYWDGQAWTDHFAPGAQEQSDGSGAVHVDEDAIWQVRGKPLSGMGAGRYKLTEHYLFFETGTLRTDSQQIPIAKVTDVDVKQSMSQKARGVGNILVHVERQQGTETVTMADVPNFREGQRLINETAHEARRTLQQHANTMRYEHSGGPQAPVDPSHARPTTDSAEANGPTLDPIEQLERLGKLRDAGVVTDEEFEAKKAEILSRI